MKAMQKFDLHMHSTASDGTDRPACVVEHAKENGVTLMALTDHDSIGGVAEAMEAGKRLGVRVIPGIEFDTEHPQGELHMLGYNIDITNAELSDVVKRAAERRILRNEGIFRRMREAGHDIEPYLPRTDGTVTRAHIAMAIVNKGLAADTNDAFKRYLTRGGIADFNLPRPTPEEMLGVIHRAGGIAVLAHPYHASGNVPALCERLIAHGLDGLEAYHSSASEGQAETLVSLANRFGVLVTCGSDSHGNNRRGVSIGCTWRETKELTRTYSFFMGE